MTTTDEIATSDEIEHRVEEADSSRHARRSVTAQQVGELAQRHAAIARQLDDIERELGDVLAAARDVIDIDELARFTGVSRVDLTRWLTARKSGRTKRKRPAPDSSGVDNQVQDASDPHARRPRPADAEQ